MHFSLRDVGVKLFSDLVFWAPQILGSLARSVVSSRLLGLFDGFSTSGLDSAQFLFASSLVSDGSSECRLQPTLLQGGFACLQVATGCWGHSGQEPLCGKLARSLPKSSFTDRTE